jgi:peptide/nickel transport system substrate-binding protein
MNAKGKQTAAMILALAMVFMLALSACGGGSEPSETSDPSDATADEVVSDAATQIAQEALAYSALVSSERKAGAVSSKDSLVFAAVLDPGKISLDNLLDFTHYPFATSCVEYFIRWDFEAGEYYSPVCDSFELDADGLGVTFHITPGIKMHDGETFESSDLLTSIEAFRNDAGLGWQLDFVDLDASEAIDEYTCDIRFTAPNGVWAVSLEMLTLISGKSYTPGDESFYQAPVGPAAYRVTEWVPGDHITVTAFEDYYRGAPPIKTQTMKVISDRTSAFMALQNGEIDLLWNISADQVVTTHASEDLKLVMTGQNMMIYMGMNAGNEALADFRVRQAIYLAVNRDDIIRGAYDGLAFPANSILTVESIGYNKDYDTNSPFPARDVEKAKALMEDAGYGDGLTLRVLAESTINFQLVVEQLSAQLGEIGITLKPELTDYASVSAKIFSGDTTAYDLYMQVVEDCADSIATIDNPMLFGASHPELSSDGSGAAYREICDAIRATADISERASLYEDMQTYFFDKGLYWLPLAASQTYVGISKDLTGLRFNGFLVYFEEAYFK